MTISPPFFFTAAVIFSLCFLYLPRHLHGLGSGATAAISYSTATVCGVVAGEPNRRIECVKDQNRVFIQPNVSYDSIAGGRSFFCGLRSGGRYLLCWDTDTFAPKRVYFNNSAPLIEISVGDDQVCGVVNGTNGVICWRGTKGFDQNPRGVYGFRSVSSGIGFSCGILVSNNTVRCWGSDFTVAYQIESEFENISMSSIVAGGGHVCGLNLTGFLVCKGRNASGQLNFPVNEAFGFSKLALGLDYSCGIRQPNGSVVCWGGGGRYSSNVTQGVGFETLVGGLNFTCGIITRNFSIICWGPGWLNHGALAKHADRAEEFSFKELAAATNNFSLEKKIGAGSFGVIYKGKLSDGREVAIKRGETGPRTKKLQEKECAFESEIAFLSRLHHKHLVRLVGYCEERDERLLVYEYMKNGALYDHLHDKSNIEKHSSFINSWKVRIGIALDAARGIEYLHNYAVPPIIHRDIKSSNILLDANWTARVSDFGLSMMGHELNKDLRPLSAAGTLGYIDPEYYSLNVLTAKSDVYGFGVVLLELLTGKKAIIKGENKGDDPISVVDYAIPAIMAGELGKILDPRVGQPELNEAEAVELFAYTALHCVNLEGKDRPTMTDIVANLERALTFCEDSHGSISSVGISIASD
ncbi:hypothetical protein Cgig2_032738 [Carnegiea gigantea]|uniref:non-specific serine/threonine protein kinase n=1 Tax=Carnegiea gigantea TaxID=171969 RepID=A0A9Q1KI34_9CARY|nr:hypothetical protein Cgig2_032738 [Carnegiea gigantea]